MSSKAARKVRKERDAVERAAVDQAQRNRDRFIELVRRLPGPDKTGGQMIPQVAQVVDEINREAAWRITPHWVVAVWGERGVAQAYGVRP